ncbi:Hypothetical predicted protein [Pelobates cultripes]|uniref:Uncharacterized protein n=1 Tax=Pelobates cultripes TaxID=61616 RepID=A0AAD1RB49_PELCU|nr:Hypothetical predicted protein [Pelobates cultripes]
MANTDPERPEMGETTDGPHLTRLEILEHTGGAEDDWCMDFGGGVWCAGEYLSARWAVERSAEGLAWPGELLADG